MPFRIVSSAGFLLTLAACVQAPNSQPLPDSPRGSAGPTVPLAGPDSITRRCRIGIDRAQPPTLIAARCAEEFIARNGYTDVGPSPDSTLWAAESFELPWGSVAELMDARRHTLESRAALVCYGFAPADRGFTVAFRHRGETLGTGGRAVLMGQNYDGMVVIHQDLDLGAAASDPKCSVL